MKATVCRFGFVSLSSSSLLSFVFFPYVLLDGFIRYCYHDFLLVLKIIIYNYYYFNPVSRLMLNLSSFLNVSHIPIISLEEKSTCLKKEKEEKENELKEKILKEKRRKAKKED
jgi:hypothetical protein